MNKYEVRALGVVCTLDASSARVAVNRGLQSISHHRTKAKNPSVEKVMADMKDIDINVKLIASNIPKKKKWFEEDE